MLFRDIAGLFEQITSTSKRLEKTFLISQFLKSAPEKDLGEVMLLIQGKIFPAWDERKVGFSSKLAVKAICQATGSSEKEVIRAWKELGDLGDVAKAMMGKKKQSSLVAERLELKSVFSNLQRLASMEGKGSVQSKLDIISGMLASATPVEAKYIIRTSIDNLRVGIGSGTVRDALLWAYLGYDKKYSDNSFELADEERKGYNEVSDRVQHAYDLSNDWGSVAKALKKGLDNLDEISLAVGNPLNVMLFQKAGNIEEAFEKVGKPAALEYKYDGFRVQVHKSHDKTVLFTRRLEDVTAQFPDIVEAAGNIKCSECILDCEAIGYDPKSGKYIPFQKISQRIKRKYNIQELARDYPVELNVFDAIYIDGKSLLNEPFIKRRSLIEKVVRQKPRSIVLAKQLVTDDMEKAQAFYEESLRQGEEGVMAKNLEGVYKPGSRVGYGVKVKPIMEPLDLVIVAAEYGEGKRSGMLTSFILACRSGDELLETGRVSTGLKEVGEGVSFADLTRLLKPIVTSSRGKMVEVKPEIVIEVGYEEIQRSTSYSSGFALRFPRFLRLRTDEKTVKDINTLEEVERLFFAQRSRSK